jgi:hypothetical protein
LVVKRLFSWVIISGALLALIPASVSADPVCGARVTVREVSRQPNDDGTRTLKYRASVQAEPAEGTVCSRVSFSVMRSYVKADGSTAEAGIPMTLEVRKRSTVDGEDVLPTSRLVYWWADQVRCEPCSAAASAPGRARPQARAEKAEEKTTDKASTNGRKKAAAVLGAVALGALLLL